MDRIKKNSRLYIWLVFVLCISAGCASTSQKPAVFTVEIKDMKFVPDIITVNIGDTIVWINRDLVAHDATEETSKAWTSGPIASGESWKMAVSEPADYYCSIHVVMKGKIQVK